MGEMRPCEGKQTKDKKFIYRITNYEDLLPTKSDITYGKPKPNFTNVKTNRNIMETYKVGPMYVNSNKSGLSYYYF